jgi:hypothetical protein
MMTYKYQTNSVIKSRFKWFDHQGIKFTSIDYNLIFNNEVNVRVKLNRLRDNSTPGVE